MNSYERSVRRLIKNNAKIRWPRAYRLIHFKDDYAASLWFNIRYTEDFGDKFHVIAGLMRKCEDIIVWGSRAGQLSQGRHIPTEEFSCIERFTPNAVALNYQQEEFACVHPNIARWCDICEHVGFKCSIYGIHKIGTADAILYAGAGSHNATVLENYLAQYAELFGAIHEQLPQPIAEEICAVIIAAEK
jgi:hypothetical protein